MPAIISAIAGMARSYGRKDDQALKMHGTVCINLEKLRNRDKKRTDILYYLLGLSERVLWK